jgi:UDP-N-acetylglucosamine 2-epimerase (non-hydrolysing)|tara:strand:+ start:3033 stop:4040 length:1008 start_codon:yes stop_codon:yes gene_type:complete
MILICYGTRPEHIKISPLLKEMDDVIPYKTLFTGQHRDLVKNINFDHSLTISEGINRLDTVVQSCLNLDESIFQDVTHILVQGDTVSAYSLALAAFHRGIKIIHLEAGLRTYDFDNPYPEEAYRQCISRISDINLCPTQNNLNNLQGEKINGDSVVVGNTVLDNLVDVQNEYGNKILITMHRRENHYNMDEWFKQINQLAIDNPELKFEIPLHPNPNVKKHKDLLTHVSVVSPFDYDTMIKEISECRFLISDSGGIQEESSFLNKKVIVCRKITERPESVGKHSFMCGEPKDLKGLFYSLKDNYEVNLECPYGDGRSSKRIVNYLKEKIYGNSSS